MDDKTHVPEPPAEQVVISAEDAKRLESWVDFFRKLSLNRTNVLKAKSVNFSGFLAKVQNDLREQKPIEAHNEIIGWPSEEQIAFVVTIDSREPGSVFSVSKLDDIYFFCFDDLAFSPMHFEWDGDGDAGNWAKTYSIRGYTRDVLQWNFITSRIINKVCEYENRVPPPPDAK